MKAVGINVLVKRDEVESVTPGGIVLPESSKRKSSKGTVVSIGEEVFEYCPEEYSVGNKVLFSSYTGTDVDEEHVVLKHEDILCIL